MEATDSFLKMFIYAHTLRTSPMLSGIQTCICVFLIESLCPSFLHDQICLILCHFHLLFSYAAVWDILLFTALFRRRTGRETEAEMPKVPAPSVARRCGTGRWVG